jgi:hypothetical protein
MPNMNPKFEIGGLYIKLPSTYQTSGGNYEESTRKMFLLVRKFRQRPDRTTKEVTYWVLESIDSGKQVNVREKTMRNQVVNGRAEYQ